MTVLEELDKGKAFPAIYKLKGDRFTICRVIDPAKPRPTAFTTTAGSGLIKGVWKRATP